MEKSFYASEDKTIGNLKQKRPRIEGFDLIRTVAALMIVVYHFACQTAIYPACSNLHFLMNYQNGNWGEITAVAVFFMISGATLVYNYPVLDFKSLGRFYKKRWLSIFPSFLLVWGYYYIQCVVNTHNFLYAGNFKILLLSFAGMDGYFLYLTNDYYYVGEWFLGAIILLYLLFPLLHFLYRRFCAFTSVLLTVAWIAVIRTHFFKISVTRNLITCIFCMWLGMLIMKFFDYIYKKRIITIIAAAIFLMLLFIPLRINTMYTMIAAACALFVVLLNVSPLFCKNRLSKLFIGFSSKISYQIFLLQHLIIAWLVNACANSMQSYKREGIILLFVFIFTYFFAWVLSIVTKEVISTVKNMVKTGRAYLQSKIA